METSNLIIRADASSQIGTGHIMRCIALAQGWQTHSRRATFITNNDNPLLMGRLRNEKYNVVQVKHPYPNPIDWLITSQVLADHPKAWVVLDGYHFDSSYQLLIKECDHQLFVIDDMAHIDHYYADIILNQNIHASQLPYACEPYTRLLLGSKYVILRREFQNWNGWKREIPEKGLKLLVTLGGADPDKQTIKVINALHKLIITGIETLIVVGASNLYLNEIETAISCSPHAIKLTHNAGNMPELMAWADLAISAGGSTCWEMAYMGLPNILIVLAENQSSIANALSDAGISLNLGWHEQVTENHLFEALFGLILNRERRRQMSKKGRQLVDNFGTERVLQALQAQ